MPSIRFLLKRIYGLEEVVWKIPRRLFSAWPSLVSEWNERSISESHFCLTNPIKFLLMRTYSLEEDIVWRISRWLFSWWPSLISEQILVSILPWILPSVFCSRENMGLKMLFEEFQDGYLVHGHLWYLNGKILAILSLKRALSFEDVVWRIPWGLSSAWPSLVSECNDLSFWLNWLMPTIKALPKRTYSLEDVVWRNSIWLFSAWPFLISEWDDFSYSESPCC